MKKQLVLSAFSFTFLFNACGPAAEDREKMHARAKVFQDSIATVIRNSMAEAEMPGVAPVVVDTTLAGINARAAAAANAKAK